jgi:hypothetical protein
MGRIVRIKKKGVDKAQPEERKKPFRRFTPGRSFPFEAERRQIQILKNFKFFFKKKVAGFPLD